MIRLLTLFGKYFDLAWSAFNAAAAIILWNAASPFFAALSVYAFHCFILQRKVDELTAQSDLLGYCVALLVNNEREITKNTDGSFRLKTRVKTVLK